MAEVTPATASLPDGSTKPRPEKPDEAKYKADLEEAEKNHKAAQAKLVCYVLFSTKHNANWLLRTQFVQNLKMPELGKIHQQTKDSRRL